MKRARASVLVLVLACGSRPPAPAESPAARASAPPPAKKVETPFATFPELEARAAESAPLMQVVDRTSGPWEMRAERDVCLRAVYAAQGSLRVFFVDDEGALRGNPAEGASGVVPPEGPACARKGEKLRLATTSAETAVRIVVLRAP